jgi:hypothetical protein
MSSEEDNDYVEYYLEDNYFIHVQCVYVNASTREIQQVKSDLIWMDTPNHISHEEIVQVMKNNYLENGQRYYLMSLLLYQVLLDPSEIKLFLSSPEFEAYKCASFFRPLYTLDPIPLAKTISMFQNMNELIVVLMEEKPAIHRRHAETRKIIHLRSSPLSTATKRSNKYALTRRNTASGKTKSNSNKQILSIQKTM